MMQKHKVSLVGRWLFLALGCGTAGSSLAATEQMAFPTPPILDFYSPIPPKPAPQPGEPNDGNFPKLPPGLPSLPPGSRWQEIASNDPGAICSEGAPYAYFILDGDPDKLIINFTGGGACADAESCDTSKSPTFFKDLGITRILVSETFGRGVFSSADQSNNPLKGWTHFVIPNCTGDLNLGDIEQTYTRADGSTFKIKHNGAPNTRAALAWLKARYQGLAKAPSKVVVGSSAGAYASIVWTAAVRALFPKASVRQFADCGAGVGDDRGAFPPQWNATASYPAWVPGLDPAKDDVAHLGLNAIYKLEAAHYPDVEFSQFNYNHDGIQSYFFKNAGRLASLWTLGLYLKIEDLVDHVPNFHSFIAGGKAHAVLVLPDTYTLETNGVKFSTWFSDYIEGKQPTTVTAWPF